MNEILSRGEFEDGAWRSMDVLSLSREDFSGSWDEYHNIIKTTILYLATALNAHPENPTELKAHEDLVDMLREKGWLT